VFSQVKIKVQYARILRWIIERYGYGSKFTQTYLFLLIETETATWATTRTARHIFRVKTDEESNKIMGGSERAKNSELPHASSSPLPSPVIFY
jgi:hypothetical protein